MKNLLFYEEVKHSLNNETHLINQAGGILIEKFRTG